MKIIILAVACQWNGGDIVFATSVQSTAQGIQRTYDTNDGLITIDLKRQPGAFQAPLTFIEHGVKSTKLAKCQMVEE